MINKTSAKKRSYKINAKTTWTIDDGLCKGCGLCIANCPLSGLEFSKDDLGVYSTPAVKVKPENCKVCRQCEQICPDSAIKIISKK